MQKVVLTCLHMCNIFGFVSIVSDATALNRAVFINKMKVIHQ